SPARPNPPPLRDLLDLRVDVLGCRLAPGGLAGQGPGVIATLSPCPPPHPWCGGFLSSHDWDIPSAGDPPIHAAPTSAKLLPRAEKVKYGMETLSTFATLSVAVLRYSHAEWWWPAIQ